MLDVLLAILSRPAFWVGFGIGVVILIAIETTFRGGSKP